MSCKEREMLYVYLLPNTCENYEEFLASEILTPVLNI